MSLYILSYCLLIELRNLCCWRYDPDFFLINLALPSLCFSDRSEKQNGFPGLWLLWNRWAEFRRNLTGSKVSMSSTKFVFSGKKQDGCPDLLLAETLSTSPLKPLNVIQQNLTGSKISTSSTKPCVFQADRKNKMAVPAPDWLRHF